MVDEYVTKKLLKLYNPIHKWAITVSQAFYCLPQKYSLGVPISSGSEGHSSHYLFPLPSLDCPWAFLVVCKSLLVWSQASYYLLGNSLRKMLMYICLISIMPFGNKIWDVVHTCNPSTQEAEAAVPQVWGQPGLCSKFQASLGYVHSEILSPKEKIVIV
jgi:hypothetical protein